MVMAKELREADESIEDGDLSLIALNGLDQSYDAFVTANTVGIDSINFSAFLDLLRACEVRL